VRFGGAVVTELRCPRHLHAEADGETIVVLCSRCTADARRRGDGRPVYHAWRRRGDDWEADDRVPGAASEPPEPVGHPAPSPGSAGW
jgi:hypothetical protein